MFSPSKLYRQRLIEIERCKLIKFESVQTIIQLTVNKYVVIVCQNANHSFNYDMIR